MNNEEIESKMNSSLIHFNKEINALRTGRASTALVEDILVDSYGTKVPINQLGNIIRDPKQAAQDAVQNTIRKNTYFLIFWI